MTYTHQSHYNLFYTTAKFFDLAPEDEIELKSLKLNLFLNLASCYIKLENWDQVTKYISRAYCHVLQARTGAVALSSRTFPTSRHPSCP